uniref:Uncharacterized protein n=1 Tax=Oryza punctata TaxID=4537 RepID=A0A0E0K1H6_ORYPU
MAMTSKIVGATALVLLVLTAVSEGQVLPTPCCRIDCCDGKPECCDPGAAVATVVAATAVTTPAAAAVTSKAGPAAATAGATKARKVSAGN